MAGGIASNLAIPPTHLSFHLKASTQAGLFGESHQGRVQRDRVNLAPIRDRIGDLTQARCAGHPEQCVGLRERSQGSNAVALAA